jgi:F0F1-type ATP synthase assembly protein I
VGQQEEASKRKRASQERKVLVFTLAMGVLVAGGSLGGLFVGYLINGGSIYDDPFLPLGLSLLGLALSIVAVDRLAKKLLTKWIA